MMMRERSFAGAVMVCHTSEEPCIIKCKADCSALRTVNSKSTAEEQREQKCKHRAELDTKLEFLSLNASKSLKGLVSPLNPEETEKRLLISTYLA